MAIDEAKNLKYQSSFGGAEKATTPDCKEERKQVRVMISFPWVRSAVLKC